MADIAHPRILSVSNFFDTHGGGLERVAGHLSREFSAAGFEAAWAASDADRLPENPAQLIPLRCANPTERLTGLPMPIPGLKSARDLNRAIAQSELIVIHDALYITSILAMILAKLRGRPVVLIQHIGLIAFANPLLRGLMVLANLIVTRAMLAAADRIIFISATVRRELLGASSRHPSVLAFNGVDHATFRRDGSEASNALREHWQIPNDKLVGVFVGRLVEKKGLAILQQVAKKRSDIHLVIAGRGPVNPAKWCLPNVQIVGQQPQGALAELYWASDFLLLPSVGEGYPLVIQEAMACGLPVICGRGSAEADPQARRWLFGVDIELARPHKSAERCVVAIDRLKAEGLDRDAMADYAASAYSWKNLAETVVAGWNFPTSIGLSS